MDAFDDRFSLLWERVGPRFAFAVRRDAAYLTWKFLRPPHVRYAVAAHIRDGEVAGYLVHRNVDEPNGRVTLLVDFLADPDDHRTMRALLRWLEREAIAAGSAAIRVFSTCTAFHGTFQEEGYVYGNPGMRFVAKINAVNVPATFYDSAERWHVTLGDSDADR